MEPSDYMPAVVAAISSTAAVLGIMLPVLYKGRRDQHKVNNLVLHELTPNSGASTKDSTDRIKPIEKKLDYVLRRINSLDDKANGLRETQDVIQEDLHKHVTESNNLVQGLNVLQKQGFQEAQIVRRKLHMPLAISEPPDFPESTVPHRPLQRRRSRE